MTSVEQGAGGSVDSIFDDAFDVIQAWQLDAELHEHLAGRLQRRTGVSRCKAEDALDAAKVKQRVRDGR